MKNEELSAKLREIVNAVKQVPGIKINSVDTDLDLNKFYTCGDVLPKIISMELVVKIGLKLEAEE